MFKSIRLGLQNAVKLINDKLHKNKSGAKRAKPATPDSQTAEANNKHDSDCGEYDEVNSENNNDDDVTTAEDHDDGESTNAETNNEKHDPNTELALLADYNANRLTNNTEALPFADDSADKVRNAQYKTTAQELIKYIMDSYVEKYHTKTTTDYKVARLPANNVKAGGGSSSGGAAGSATSVRKKSNKLTKSKHPLENWTPIARAFYNRFMSTLICHFYSKYENLLLQRYTPNAEKQEINADSLILQRLYRSVLLELDLVELFGILKSNLPNLVFYPLREFLRFATPQVIKMAPNCHKPQIIDEINYQILNDSYSPALDNLFNISQSISSRSEPVEIKSNAIREYSFAKFDKMSIHIDNLYKYEQNPHEFEKDVQLEECDIEGNLDHNVNVGIKNLTFRVLKFQHKQVIFDCLNHPGHSSAELGKMSWLERINSMRPYFLTQRHKYSFINLLNTTYDEVVFDLTKLKETPIVYVTVVGIGRSRYIFSNKKSRPTTRRFHKITVRDISEPVARQLKRRYL